MIDIIELIDILHYKSHELLCSTRLDITTLCSILPAFQMIF